MKMFGVGRKCRTCQVVFPERIGWKCPCCGYRLSTAAKTDLKHRQLRLENRVRY